METKKVWNTETRNEQGKYYRDGDWGATVDCEFTKPSFSENSPPVESLENNIPCDFINDEWVLDVEKLQEYEESKTAYQVISNMNIDQVDLFIENTDTKEALKSILKSIVLIEKNGKKWKKEK